MTLKKPKIQTLKSQQLFFLIHYRFKSANSPSIKKDARDDQLIRILVSVITRDWDEQLRLQVQ